MSELGDQVTPTVELPLMRLPPRLLMDEVCFQVDNMQSLRCLILTFSFDLVEGFNWSEQIKNRAERSASINSQATTAPAMGPLNHQKAASTSAAEQPIKEMPKSPKRPDHFQERILKGDFYMD